MPEGADLRDIYHTPQFEREITLPDRTRAMCDHLAGLLNRTGPMDRTMVFCVDMAHARLVAENLQTSFGHLGYDNYAVPIISEEGEEGRRALEQFQDSDRKVPVVATTAELLSTGVDVPSCRNIVFMTTLASPLLFKQIIGRGSRVDPATDKLWFRIVDYTGSPRSALATPYVLVATSPSRVVRANDRPGPNPWRWRSASIRSIASTTTGVAFVRRIEFIAHHFLKPL